MLFDLGIISLLHVLLRIDSTCFLLVVYSFVLLISVIWVVWSRASSKLYTGHRLWSRSSQPCILLGIKTGVSFSVIATKLHKPKGINMWHGGLWHNTELWGSALDRTFLLESVSETLVARSSVFGRVTVFFDFDESVAVFITPKSLVWTSFKIRCSMKLKWHGKYSDMLNSCQCH